MSAAVIQRSVDRPPTDQLASERTVSRRWADGRLALAIVISGLAVGVITQILQGVLPDGWGVLANSGVMWALMAFALGACMPTQRWAAAGGAAQLVIASIIYYMAVDWFEGTSSDARGAIIWSAAGIVAGSVFGLFGHVFARSAAWRWPALAIVAGVLVGEGIHLSWFVGNADLRPAGVAELAVAGVLAIVCITGSVRSALRWSSAIVVGVTVAAGAATLAAGKLIDAAFLAA